MSLGLSRGDLQVLTDSRIEEAAVLFAHGHWSGAYYLGGYALELGLKACIAKMISADVIPDKTFLNSIYTHSPAQLVGVSGLSADLKERQTNDADFHANWGIIGQWGPDARYKPIDRSTSQYFLDAITNQDHGVLPWIKTFW